MDSAHETAPELPTSASTPDTPTPEAPTPEAPSLHVTLQRSVWPNDDARRFLRVTNDLAALGIGTRLYCQPCSNQAQAAVPITVGRSSLTGEMRLVCPCTNRELTGVIISTPGA